MSGSNIATAEMALIWKAKYPGDRRNEEFTRVINLKTWDAKMHIALMASHNR
jgi:hypothetical protein